MDDESLKTSDGIIDALMSAQNENSNKEQSVNFVNYIKKSIFLYIFSII